MGGFISNNKYFSFKTDSEINDEKIEEVLKEQINRVQIDSLYINTISKNCWNKLNEKLFIYNPKIKFRIYGGGNIDLEFLVNLSSIYALSIEVDSVTNISTLSSLKNLKELHFFVNFHLDFSFIPNLSPTIEKISIGTNNKNNYKVDISSIQNLNTLKNIHIEGYNYNIDKIVPRLKNIQCLTLKSVSKIKDLLFLHELTALKKLHLKSCGINNYNALAEMENIICLEIWKPSKLEQLDFISSMKGIQLLYLQTVNNVNSFPDIFNLIKLKRIVLISLKDMHNFQTLEKSSSIEEFCFYDIKKQTPIDFIPILKNKNLKSIYLWSLSPKVRLNISELMKKYNYQNKYINYLNDLDFIYEK